MDGDRVGPVTTVLVDGRAYVSVEDLVRSLRERVDQVVRAAEASSEPAVRVAALARSEELAAWADALVVSWLEQWYAGRPSSDPG